MFVVLIALAALAGALAALATLFVQPHAKRERKSAGESSVGAI
jgi:hypothetical protein